MEDRLARTRLLLGEKGIEKLQKATVMVVGCGAVGSFAIEALARAGVGRLILVDFDVVKESNINRQLFALQSTLGQEKTAVACGRIHDISPDIQVEVIPALINGENVAALISYKPDFVIDAIDTLNPKTLLIESLVRAGIPFISSMGAALKVDPSKIAIVPMKKPSTTRWHFLCANGCANAACRWILKWYIHPRTCRAKRISKCRVNPKTIRGAYGII